MNKHLLITMFIGLMCGAHVWGMDTPQPNQNLFFTKCINDLKNNLNAISDDIDKQKFIEELSEWKLQERDINVIKNIVNLPQVTVSFDDFFTNNKNREINQINVSGNVCSGYYVNLAIARLLDYCYTQEANNTSQRILYILCAFYRSDKTLVSLLRQVTQKYPEGGYKINLRTIDINDTYALIDWCFQQGALIDNTANCESSLSYAIENHIPKIVELLLKHGADPNQVINILGGDQLTPLVVAIINNKSEVIPVLLKYGADHQQQNLVDQIKYNSIGVVDKMLADIALKLDQVTESDMRLKILKSKDDMLKMKNLLLSNHRTTDFKTIGILCISAAALYFCVDRLYTWWYPDTENDEAETGEHEQDGNEQELVITDPA